MKNPKIIIIGAGFYGCMLSLFFKSITNDITIVEANSDILQRASKNNQARVHTGFHYPRSFMTAIKSLELHKRFIKDFPEAIYDDFEMLYAISKNRSKITSKRFFKTYKDLEAPIQKSTNREKAFFNMDLIEDVYVCKEHVFDSSIIRDILKDKISKAKIKCFFNSKVKKIIKKNNSLSVLLDDGNELQSDNVFNVSYSQINNILKSSKLDTIPLKHQLTETAFIEVPEKMSNYGVTIMDGPFMSSIPFPQRNLHSLTHVRYTPHFTWKEKLPEDSGFNFWDLRKNIFSSNFKNMILDTIRYLPLFESAKYIESIFEVKTLYENDRSDDGRPILFHNHSNDSKIFSILGAKIDNIYDLLKKISQEKSFYI